MYVTAAATAVPPTTRGARFAARRTAIATRVDKGATTWSSLGTRSTAARAVTPLTDTPTVLEPIVRTARAAACAKSRNASPAFLTVPAMRERIDS